MMIAILAAIVGAGIAAAQAPASQPIANGRSTPTHEVDLSSEPSHLTGSRAPATLRQAALANDYAAFDVLARKAKANGEDLGAFADLYDVWSFSQSNATGSYFGASLYDRLAAHYPDYAKFIEEYRITDAHGQVFYPSAETRSFLLQQAIDGNDPVAARTARSAPVKASTSAPPPLPRPRTAAPGAAGAATAPTPIEPPERLPQDALSADMSKVTPEAAPVAAPQTRPVEAEMIDSGGTTRGIFLIILGLAGIGVLTMTMQTSSSEGHVADEEEQPQPPVVITAAHEAHPTESHG